MAPDSTAAALALIKPSVRAQTAYTLDAPPAPRKLNQNESPFDAPPVVKEAVLAALREEPWNRYPPFTPAELVRRLAARHGWVAEGVLVGNGSNELIQATLVVVDEAYQDFGGPTGIPLLRANPRLVVLRSFSKAMSLAGLRFGYALAHPAVAAEIAKAKLPYNVNRVTLAAAVAALDAGEVLARRTEEVRHNRDLLYQKLCAIGGLRAFPSAANFVLIRCDPRPANAAFTRLVQQYGIPVRDVSTGGPGLEGCLRITAGTEDDVTAGARALAEILGWAAP